MPVEPEVRPHATKGVDSARRVLEILLDFAEAESGVTVDDIATAYGLSTASAYRYLALLREMYLVEEDQRGRYVLSPHVLRLATAAENSIALSRAGAAVVNGLMRETGQSVLILKRVRDMAVCVVAAKPDRELTLSFAPGQLMPLTRGAGAKVLLAAASKRRIERTLAEMPRAESEELRTELPAIRRLRIAESDSEVDEGVWAVAAPIQMRGKTIAALSIAGPSFLISEDQRARFRSMAEESAAGIGAALAGP